MTVYSNRLKIPIHELDDQPVDLFQAWTDRTAILDTLVDIAAVTLAQRPVSSAASPGVVGRMRIITDQPNSPRIDLDMGTSWVTISSSVTDGDPTLPLTRSLGTGAQQACAGNDVRLFEPGDIKCSAVVNVPTGWLLCNGAAVLRTTYVDLFNAIGTAYGAGDGSTTFALPDMRDTFPVGVGTNGRGVRGGVASVVLAIANLPSHDHGTYTGTETADHAHYTSGTTGNDSPDHAHNITFTGNVPVTQSGPQGAAVYGGSYTTSGATARHAHSFAAWSGGRNTAHQHQIPAQGGGTGHENRPPFQCLNFFIKT